MADFRKWLLALAAVAGLLGLGSSTAVAATTFTCQTNAGNPTIVRAEGVAELVGDLTLNCTGGTPTAAGQLIPLSTVQISLNTNVTSRLITGNTSEALLLIDEPFPGPASGTGSENPSLVDGGTANTNGSAGSPNPGGQLGCLANNSTNCAITSVGAGVGATGSYNGTTATTGSPLGTGNHYNVFQGIQNSASSIAWQGVPIDAPGTAGTRTIRITNIRANACLLGVSSTFIPTQITELIGISGSQNLLINNPTQVVAEAEQGILISNNTAVYTQCNSLNATLLGGTGGVTGTTPTVNITEGFSASFKERNIDQVLAAHGEGPGAGTGSSSNTSDPDSDVGLQNIPGFAYNTESGFVPGQIGATLGAYNPGGTGVGSVGLASQGTEIQLAFAGVPAGVSLNVPTSIPLTGGYGLGVPVGEAVLVSSTTGGLTVSGSTASAVYEILYADPSVTETLSVPVTTAFITTGPGTPGVGSVTVQVNLAPLSTSPTASTFAPIPRFCQPYVPANLFVINLCTCNLLFPFVTNQAGFDTGVAIANTTADVLNGLAPQTGDVTLTYYGNTTGGGAAPPTAVTTSAVPSGAELVFTLSGGGNYGIPATPGFQGYIIAQADFQYCHGFAFISDAGAQKLAEGYLALELDIPGLHRTGITGEVLAH